MTTNEAIGVVRIMVHHNLNPEKQIAVLLVSFDVNLVDFFNAADEFLDTDLHDRIFGRLAELRIARERCGSRRKS